MINLVPEIKAAVLYAAVSQRYNNNTEGIEMYDLEATDAAFSVHHGVMDETIFLSSSQTLCEDLKKAGREAECYFYEDQPPYLYPDRLCRPALYPAYCGFLRQIFTE